MGLILPVLLLLFPIFAEARAPIPFSNPYRDGYVLTLWDDIFNDAQIDSFLKRIPRTHVDSLTIPVFGCQRTIDDSYVDSCTVQNRKFIMHVAKIAQAQGFELIFLPILMTPKSEWRGFFQPKDIQKWFETYTVWIRELAKEARQFGMKEFIVASEFVKLYKYTKQWKNVISEVRKEFSGPLIATVNWDSLDVGFWEDLDAIGISAYRPLSDETNPGQEELNKAWNKIRDDWSAYSKKWKRPIHITELGYHSSTDAAKSPWEPSAKAKYNEQLQAKCFQAFKNTWEKDRNVVRVSVWSIGFPPQVGEISFDPIGRPAESVLNAFFAARSTL